MDQPLPPDAPKRPYHALKGIPDIDRKILDGISAGRSLKSIADEHGVGDVAILQRARKYPDYKARLEVGMELRMDRREQELEIAADNVSVTRADRLLGHARWLAERSCPDRWGQKAQGGSGSITVVVQRGDVVITSDDAAPLPQESLPITLDHQP